MSDTQFKGKERKKEKRKRKVKDEMKQNKIPSILWALPQIKSVTMATFI